MRVTKIFQWDAAHKLCLDYESPCNKLHGHTYKVELELEGDIMPNGMVMDFAQLKKAIEPASFDHQHINDIEWFKRKNPTAENLVLFIKETLERNWLPGWPSIHRIRVWETPTSYAEEIFNVI